MAGKLSTALLVDQADLAGGGGASHVLDSCTSRITTRSDC